VSKAAPTDTPSVGNPFAQLEAGLMVEFFRQEGHDPIAVLTSNEPWAIDLKKRASTYASTHLATVECAASLAKDLAAGRN
jgi:hypothetical protein